MPGVGPNAPADHPYALSEKDKEVLKKLSEEYYKTRVWQGEPYMEVDAELYEAYEDICSRWPGYELIPGTHEYDYTKPCKDIVAYQNKELAEKGVQNIIFKGVALVYKEDVQ